LLRKINIDSRTQISENKKNILFLYLEEKVSNKPEKYGKNWK